MNPVGPALSIHVIDNASTDGSVEYLKQFYPSVRITETGRNLGFSGGANLGLKLSTSDLVCILNNDIVVSATWLAELIKPFKDEKIAAVVPKMYDFQGNLNSAGGICDIYGFAYNLGIQEKDCGQYDSIRPVPYGCFAAVVVKRRVLEEVGTLDEDYFMYHEDVDLSWRILLAGYEILYWPRSIVLHRYMGSRKKNERSTIIYFWERNRFRTLLKNYQFPTLMKILPVLGVLKLLHLGYAIRYLDAPEALAIIKAYVWNLRNLRTTVAKRRRMQLLRKISDSELLERMVPWSIELRLGLKKIYHPIVERN